MTVILLLLLAWAVVLQLLQITPVAENQPALVDNLEDFYP